MRTRVDATGMLKTQMSINKNGVSDERKPYFSATYHRGMLAYLRMSSLLHLLHHPHRVLPAHHACVN